VIRRKKQSVAIVSQSRAGLSACAFAGKRNFVRGPGSCVASRVLRTTWFKGLSAGVHGRDARAVPAASFPRPTRGCRRPALPRRRHHILASASWGLESTRETDRAPLNRSNRHQNACWLSRPGARCRDCSRSVSPGRSPNPPCRSPGNGLSTVSAVQAWLASVQVLGILLPLYRYRVTDTDAMLNSSIPSTVGLRHWPLRLAR
jgi:hypothetical protein